jgi:aminocarboxymuconate-semialdehyde decarboxylase
MRYAFREEPGHYLKHMYVDTVSYCWPAVMMAVNTAGADHLFFDSDAPPLVPLLLRAKKLIEELPLSEEDRQAILWGNAARILKLAS